MHARSNIAGIQVLRAVAALMVVGIHSVVAIKYLRANYWVEGSNGAIADRLFLFNHMNLGIDIFFCLSGFIMAMLVAKEATGLRPATRFLLMRAIRIYPPYWICSLIVILAFYASHSSLNLAKLDGTAADIERIAKSLLLVPETKWPVLFVGWTLIFEMTFYALCTVLIAARQSHRLVSVLFAFWLIGMILERTGHSIAYGVVISPFHAKFLAGALAYRYRVAANRANPILLLGLAFGLFIFISRELEPLQISQSLFSSSGVKELLCGLMGSLSIFDLLKIGQNVDLHDHPIGDWLVRIGDASYTLYLTYCLTLSALGRFWGMIAKDAPVAGVVFIHLFSIATAVVVALIVYEKAEQPAHEAMVRWLKQRFVPGYLRIA